MTTDKINRLLTICCVCIVLFFLMLNIYTPLIADDFSYSIGVNSIGDIFISQFNHYFNWGGRSVAHFFAQFWLLVGKPIFNIANAFIYGFFIFLVKFHIIGSFKKFNPLLFLLINISFWLFVPLWGQNFLWLTGSCNYLWTSTIILFFLAPFRVKYDNPNFKLCIPLSILFMFIGVLSGWSNENSGAAVLFFLIIYFLYKISNKNKLSLFEILGAIGFLIGFLLLIAAPGNYVRAEFIKQSNIDLANTPFLLILIKRFLNITSILYDNNGILLIGISIFLGFDLVYYKKQKLHLFSYLYAFSAIAGAYSMLLSPSFPLRAFFIITVFSIILLGNLLFQIELKIPDIVKRYFSIIIILIIIHLSFSFITATKGVMGVYFRWYDRIEYINQEKEKGVLDIEVKIIPTHNKKTALYDLSDVTADKEDWPNTSIATYFGISSIKSNDELPENLWNNMRKRFKQIILIKYP